MYPIRTRWLPYVLIVAFIFSIGYTIAVADRVGSRNETNIDTIAKNLNSNIEMLTETMSFNGPYFNVPPKQQQNLSDHTFLKLRRLSKSGSDTKNETCESYKSCRDCVDDADELDLDCYWCESDSSCSDKSGSCSEDIFGECQESYYITVFIIVSSILVCLCCAACYLRHWRSNRHHDRGLGRLVAPLVPNAARSYIFRNSFADETGEKEWMCVICGFDNKPRSKHCTMCGTEQTFSKGYKTHKRAKHMRAKEKRLNLLLKQRQEAMRSRKEESDDGRIVSYSGNDSGSISNGVDIPISKDAQINSVSMSLRFFSPSSAAKHPSQQPACLSADQRAEALNYRRLNQLSLRQKSARRRKVWQRRVDPQDPLGRRLVWVRVPLSEVRVADAPFGYTPRPSLCDSEGGGWRWGYPDDNASTNTSLLSLSRNHYQQGPAGMGAPSLFDPVEDLLAAAAASSMSSSIMQPASEAGYTTPSKQAPHHQHQQMPMSASVGARSRVSAVGSGSRHQTNSLMQGLASPATSVRLQRVQQRGRALSQDSFGDEALLSCSPGFTSAFDERGELVWQRVEPTGPTTTTTAITSGAPTAVAAVAVADGMSNSNSRGNSRNNSTTTVDAATAGTAAEDGAGAADTTQPQRARRPQVIRYMPAPSARQQTRHHHRAHHTAGGIASIASLLSPSRADGSSDQSEPAADAVTEVTGAVYSDLPLRRTMSTPGAVNYERNSAGHRPHTLAPFSPLVDHSPHSGNLALALHTLQQQQRHRGGGAAPHSRSFNVRSAGGGVVGGGLGDGRRGWEGLRSGAMSPISMVSGLGGSRHGEVASPLHSGSEVSTVRGDEDHAEAGEEDLLLSTNRTVAETSSSNHGGGNGGGGGGGQQHTMNQSHVHSHGAGSTAGSVTDSQRSAAASGHALLFNSRYLPHQYAALDLQAVAAMTYKDKLVWFLDQMATYQIPAQDGFVKIELRRRRVLEDAFHAFGQLTRTDMHKWLRIEFLGEPGLDAGGLEREFFQMVNERLFGAEVGLFDRCSSDELGAYHISPLMLRDNPRHMSYYHFVGRFFGKAIMEQQPLRAHLSVPLRKQILSVPVTFSDLEFMDEELFRNLCWLKTHSGVEHLMLDFSVTYSAHGRTATHELKPGGAEEAVTDDNKEEYLQLRLRHRMLDSIKAQLEHFLRGLYEVIPPELLSVFDYQELDLLLCGVSEIDISDWRRHTEYMGAYRKLGAKHHIIRWFWLAVEEMSPEEQVRLLQFTTGCARLPAQGFKALQSTDGRYRKFNIQSISKEVSQASEQSPVQIP